MRAVPSIASGTRHIFGVGLQALLIAAILGLAALAASAIYKPAAFIAGVDNVSAARNYSGHITVPDGNYGDTTVATVNPGGDVWVRARCFQGSLVYEQYVKANGANQATLTLGPTPSWSSGDATCIAQEGTFGKTNRWKVLAETTFNAWDR
jgi:hypothetical protein